MTKVDPPRDLTIPDPGSTTARAVLSRAVGLAMRELRALPAVGAARAPVLALRDRIEAIVRVEPGALASVARRPTVGAPLRALRHARDADRGQRAAALAIEVVATAALDLAIAGALGKKLTIEAPPARLLSLAARVAIDVGAGADAIDVEDGRLTIHAPGGTTSIDLTALDDAARVRRPYHPIDGGSIVLALDDNNPLAMLEAHPDKAGNAIDLGGKEPSAWTSMIGDALALVGDHMPDLRAEMDLYLHQIVPVGYDPERHLSASYQEAIGTVYMTLHPDLMTMAEALIHEFSHNKINALFELDPVLENAFSPLYTSPVRPDPRPLHGVLLAVHAFLPVARLYERMIEEGHALASSPSFRARFEAVKRINHEGASVLVEHARPTPVGRALLGEIRRWDERYQK